MTKISLTYCGMFGTGPTVKEAKQDAARKIETFLQSDFTPVILRWKNRTGIVWITPCGVSSSLFDESGKITGECSHGTSATMASVTRLMRGNLARLEADATSDEIPAILGNDKELVADFVSWLGFQRAYTHAAGLQMADPHAYACHHCHEHRPALLAA
jgi:hypothetical protein